MKKWMIWAVLGLAVVFVAADAEATARMYPLPVEAQARYGATHVYIVKAGDFSQTTNDTAETLSYTVGAKQAAEFVGLELKTAFNLTNLTVSVRDTDTADKFLSAVQIGANLTPIYFAFPSLLGGTITVTPTLATNSFATAIVLAKDGANVTNATLTTAATVYVTGVSATFTGVEKGQAAWTAAKAIQFVFTPANGCNVAAATAGEVRFYFRMRDAAKD